ncbi:pectinesterase inhibitor 9-like [Apium graveolens]|uniref:pectinesterase inhibitor 9-like n=1 Tax=Apium graveolens TaxID=4045 RepID=UPI003D796B6B
MVEPACRRCSRSRAFVEKQCEATLYTRLCIQGLLPFVNSRIQTQQQLAQVALSVSLTRARYTRTYVIGVSKQLQRRAPDYAAVQDCLNQINDGVTQIAQSVKEFRQMSVDGEKQFLWHESNVQSWVSAALTDATACIDGFSTYSINSRVKATIKAKVLNVAQVTSNALALFNGYTARQRASFRAKKP